MSARLPSLTPISAKDAAMTRDLTPTSAARPGRLSVLLVALALLAAPALADTRTSAFVYDATSGLLTKEVIEPDNSALCLVTEYGYDAYGNKTTATTRNCNGSPLDSGASEQPAPSGDAVIQSRTTSNAMDSRGQFPTTTTNALGKSETKTYDPRFGTVTGLTGPNGLSTTWSYDAFGRKTLEIRADNTKTTWDYLYCSGVNGGTESCPTIAQQLTPSYVVVVTPRAANGAQNGPVTKTYYDGLDREIRTATEGFDGSGSSTWIYVDKIYDTLGRPFGTSRPYYAGQTVYWTYTEYDGVGRPKKITYGDGTVAGYSYDGLTSTVTNPKSQKRVTLKNSQGQPLTVTDTQGNVVNYAYDAFGNLIKSTDAQNNVITLAYDIKGRKTQMVDPDMGSWTYAYNALGQLVRQTDAKGQVSTMAYDKLGRMINRSEADLVSNWYYDSYKGGGACTKGIGKLCQSETSTGYNNIVSYDNFGRPISTSTTIDNSYSSSVTYDANGRIFTQTYPTGYVVAYSYTSKGYLKEVRNASTTALLWQANSLDAEGHLLQFTYGNGVTTDQTFDPANGRLTAIGAGAGHGVQSLSYQYDSLGNLTSRLDGNQVMTEDFVYDALNRMTRSTVNSTSAGVVIKAYSFDSLGNITYKSDIGSLIYNTSGAGSVRPHAVARVNMAGGYRTYAYDANGNLTTETQYDANNNVIASKGRTEIYTSFNMPQAIAANGYSSAFSYGPEHQRIRQNSTSSSGTTIYLNPDNKGGLFYEKDYKADGSTEERHFVTAGGQVIAIVKKIVSGGTTSWPVLYMHRDNLGSTTAITDGAGTVVERLAYEPYGKRRFPTGADDPNSTIFPVATERGFSNHEHVDELGIIEMNGRIYDPTLGRFMSPDPQIQSPYDLQSYNRYAYGFNRPLSGVDPTGYGFVDDFFDWFGDLVLSITENPKAIVGIGVSAWLGFGDFTWLTGFDAGIFGKSVLTAYTAGFWGGMVASGGDYGSALRGGLTGAMFFGVGELPGEAGGVSKVLSHAAVGCMSSALGGGKCGSGALSAGFAEFAGPRTGEWGFVGNVAKAAVLGGIASNIGGGNFSNGAVTGAFGYLFNCAFHCPDGANPNPDGSFRSSRTGEAYKGLCASTGCLMMEANRDNDDPGTKAADRRSTGAFFQFMGQVSGAVGLLFPPVEIPAGAMVWLSAIGETAATGSSGPVIDTAVSNSVTNTLKKFKVPDAAAKWTGEAAGRFVGAVREALE